MIKGVPELSRLNELVERAEGLKVNAGIEPNADLGPVISKQVMRFQDISTFSGQQLTCY